MAIVARRCAFCRRKNEAAMDAPVGQSRARGRLNKDRVCLPVAGGYGTGRYRAMRVDSCGCGLRREVDAIGRRWRERRVTFERRPKESTVRQDTLAGWRAKAALAPRLFEPQV